MASNYNEDVGSRLKKIRSISNEGGPLSASQFAFLLDETRDRITNYERGVTSVPIRLLYKLYARGINPVFIITGEGALVADNDQGILYYDKIQAKLDHIKKLFNKYPGFKVISDKLMERKKEMEVGEAPVYRVAAGDLRKARKKRKV